MRRNILRLLTVVLLLSCVACGNNGKKEDAGKEETETEVIVPIAEANDILTKVWEAYEEKDTDGNMYNDKFDIMGGHFDSAIVGMPCKYDLSKTSDLTMMYCVPESAIAQIDDAATMVHLMKASTFTVGAYHVADAANVQNIVDSIKTQILVNHWLDGAPDKYILAVIDNQYVITAIGVQEVVDNFESELKEIYGKQVLVQINENIR